MLSSLGVNFYNFNNREREEQYIIRRLMAYGIPASGDFTKDKALLKKVETLGLDHISATKEIKTENYTENTDYIQSEQVPIINEYKGAEQISILNRLKLGLI